MTHAPTTLKPKLTIPALHVYTYIQLLLHRGVLLLRRHEQQLLLLQ
jgi:hypothetical protein